VSQRPPLDDAARLRLFGGRAEGAGYYDALPGAGAVVHSADGVVVAASPTFELDFDTMRFMPGFMHWLRMLGPRSGKIHFGGLGAVNSNELGVAIDPALSPAGRASAFEGLLDAVEARGRYDITLIKDVSERDASWADGLLRRRGYRRIEGLPLAWLHLPGSTVEDFLHTLSGDERRSLQRNWRNGAALRCEVRRGPGDLEPQLSELAEATRLKAGTQFDGAEAMPPGFLSDLARCAPEAMRLLLFWHETRLLGFSLCLAGPHALYGKTLGLRYPEAIDHKVYFANLRTAIETTLAEGKSWLCLGQLAYDIKIRWGARLERRWIYFRPKPAWRWGSALFSGVIAGIKLDPAIARYAEPRYWFDANPQLPQPPVQLMQTLPRQ
jgi:hypothetical protein